MEKRMDGVKWLFFDIGSTLVDETKVYGDLFQKIADAAGVSAESVSQNRYLQYEDQKMNPRIRDAQIQGNTLIASIDGIPVTVTLPDKVMEAHAVGALPLGTLANAVLEKCDRMQEVSEARDRFEEESRSQTRGITQR